VNHQPARDHAARTIDVEHDLFVGILALEEEKLSDDDIRDVVVDLSPKEDDPVLQEPTEDVPVAFAAVRRFDDRRVRDEISRRPTRRERLEDADSLGTVFGTLANMATSPSQFDFRLGARSSSGTSLDTPSGRVLAAASRSCVELADADFRLALDGVEHLVFQDHSMST
jgi:hypothetical protein